jgi:hypothetical protein
MTKLPQTKLDGVSTSRAGDLFPDALVWFDVQIADHVPRPVFVVMRASVDPHDGTPLADELYVGTFADPRECW